MVYYVYPPAFIGIVRKRSIDRAQQNVVAVRFLHHCAPKHETLKDYQ